jgi:hypothetical protein
MKLRGHAMCRRPSVARRRRCLGGGSMSRSANNLRVIPLTLAEANAVVAKWHRHHKPVVGHRFSIGALSGGILIGAAIIGRPVARLTDQSFVAEVTRLVTDGTKNACSLLYAASARAAQAMGYDAIQTFILATEPGTSLRAAGWIPVSTTLGGGLEPRVHAHQEAVAL